MALELTQENVESIICSSLSTCVKDNFDLYLEIAKSKLAAELGYDIFDLVANGGTVKLKYDPLDSVILTPPYSSINSLTEITCDRQQDLDIGCTFKTMTRNMVYAETSAELSGDECLTALHHCSDGCGCELKRCDCTECLTIEIDAEWCCPTLLVVILAKLMDGECGKNIKSQSIEGWSVTYDTTKNPIDEYRSIIDKYSILGGIDVA